MKPINESQTETGVKDKMCGVVIARTVAKYQEERPKKDGSSTSEISQKLSVGLRVDEQQYMNPLLTMPGT